MHKEKSNEAFDEYTIKRRKELIKVIKHSFREIGIGKILGQDLKSQLQKTFDEYYLNKDVLNKKKDINTLIRGVKDGK